MQIDITKLRLFSSVLVALSIVGFALDAAAQTYPTRPIRVIVPFAPGAGTDALARVLSQRIGETIGQSLIVENRPGAGGSIGTAAVATAPADGYTLLFAPASHAVNPALYPKLGYDTLRDFTVISVVASLPIVLAVESEVDARSPRDLVNLAKAKPGQLVMGSSGNGTVFHLASEMFKDAAKIEFVHVPYRGGAPAVQAVLAREIQFIFETSLVLQPHIRSGRVRALAVASAQRIPLLPDVPTLGESGFPGIVADNWYAFHAPAGASNEVVTRLHGEIAKAVGFADVRDRLAAQGAEIRQTTPDEAAAFVRAELIKWARVAKASGAKLD